MESMEWIVGIGLGIGLAAASGLRIFVPLLGLSLAARFGGLELTPSLEWLATLPALVTFAIATVVEIGAYSVPWLDNLLDTIAAPMAVGAGALLTAAVLVDAPPMVRWGLAIIGGGGVAGMVQAGTTVTRQLSSLATGGLGNPVVSAGEAGGSIVMVLLSLLLPALALVAVVLLLIVAARGIARFTARRRVDSAAG